MSELQLELHSLISQPSEPEWFKKGLLLFLNYRLEGDIQEADRTSGQYTTVVWVWCYTSASNAFGRGQHTPAPPWSQEPPH